VTSHPPNFPRYNPVYAFLPNMKRAIYAFIAVWTLILAAPLAQGEGPIDETRFALRQEFIRIINRDRKHYGLPPVELDPWASNVADAYCKQQIRAGTTGHFSVDGQSPYMRYSFAGGNDGVSENAAAWSANYTFSDRALYEMMRRSEEAMIAEAAPHDGHRRTILDPYATHVGIGLAWEGGEFRMTQEFLRRYVHWGRSVPRNANAGEHLVLSGRTVRGYDIDAITVHHEPLPQPLTARAANAIDAYSLPDRRREYLPRLKTTVDVGRNGEVRETREEYSDGRRGDFRVAEDGSFAFAIPFGDGPGVYTVVVWVKKPGLQESIPASNVSIRVAGGTRPAVSDDASR
jgi:uncharacterized protein YkwD